MAIISAAQHDYLRHRLPCPDCRGSGLTYVRRRKPKISRADCMSCLTNAARGIRFRTPCPIHDPPWTCPTCRGRGSVDSRTGTVPKLSRYYSRKEPRHD